MSCAACNQPRTDPAIRYFPAFLDLHGRRALVVGGGEVAARKAQALARAGAAVAVEPTFNPASLRGCAVAVGADAPEAELRALAEAAKRAGIPVNVVDRPELCSFITPAIVDRDPITVAVSSAGAAPVLARDVRARIEALLPPTLGRVASLLDALKAELRAAFPELAQRRAVIDRLLAGPPAELALAGRDADARAAALREIAGPRTAAGMVFLVGAGPGSADLLTLRAHRLLGEADVIVHDRLVSAAVLDMGRRDAERIFVGKQQAEHSMPQAEINALLVRLARAGRKVVRLKGGDPLVFGHAAEEAAALEAAGIEYDIVPGITAALACAAGARVPLTEATIARTVTLASGHLSGDVLDLDFPALARAGGTLAIYMGARSLPLLCRGLRDAGMAPDTPAALVAAGAGAMQSLRADLATIAGRAAGWPHDNPSLVLIGATASLLRDPAAVDGQRRAGDGAGGVGT